MKTIHTGISGISKKINTYVNAQRFEEYLDSKGDAVAANLLIVFEDYIDDAAVSNITGKLADLFVSIITDAVGNTKAKQPQSGSSDYDDAELLKYYMKAFERSESEEDVLTKYYNQASEFYSTKKTLLYAETPHPFYEMYVCNSVTRVTYHPLFSKSQDIETINNATICDFDEPYRYVVIQGTGGIGKSMFLTHLFLSYADERQKTAKTPILIQLKEYLRPEETIVELITKTVKAYNPHVDDHDIISNSERGSIILLLDGLDEIPAYLRVVFNTALDNYIKRHLTTLTTVLCCCIHPSLAVILSSWRIFVVAPLMAARESTYWGDQQD